MRNREIEDKALINIKHSISALIVDQEEDVGILVILGAGILGALLMLIIIGKGKIDQALHCINSYVTNLFARFQAWPWCAGSTKRGARTQT